MNYATRDGVKQAYVEAGSGGPAILLVHGLQSNHTHMLPELEHLSWNYRVVASICAATAKATNRTAPIPTMSSTTTWSFCAMNSVSIGRSRWGTASAGSNLLNLAANRPGFLGGLVLFDSGVRTLSNKMGELGVVSELSQERRRKFLGDRLFGRDDPSVLKETVLYGMLAVPDHGASRMRDTVLGFDGGATALDCHIPLLFQLADKPFTDRQTLSRLGPNWRVGQAVGASHFIQVIAAAQVNAMIDRWLQVAFP